MTTVPPEFVDRVKHALEHVYDPIVLRDHPLGVDLVADWSAPSLDRARSLRRILLDGVEQIRLAKPLSADVHRGRAHQILQLRYVEGLPFRDVMANLGLSQTHYHREQRFALETLARHLWDTRPRPDVPADRPTNLSPNDLQPTDLFVASGDREELLDLDEVVRGVIGIVEGIAGAKGVEVRQSLAPRSRVIPGNRVILRQLLISAIGYLLSVADGGTLALVGNDAEPGVSLTVTYTGRVQVERLDQDGVREHLAIGQRLAELLGAALVVETDASRQCVRCTLPVKHRTLLVIEDHPDMVQLITRFVQSHGYVVRSAPTVRDGLRLARTVHPEVILLDIMLSEQDGWDALQSLKHHPDTRAIPVLVCTILPEADLALALGATAFLRKPLTQEGLLASLARCVPPRRGGAGANRESTGPTARAAAAAEAPRG